MEWITTVQGLLTLISSAVLLVSALITVAVKLYNAVKQIAKDKNWQKILEIALAAIEEAEASGKSGADKKTQVIEAVKAGCLEAGVDCTEFLDDLSKFIDDCIDWHNNLDDADIIAEAKKAQM